jgi:hypothetical protein
VLSLIRAHPGRIDGIKVSLLIRRSCAEARAAGAAIAAGVATDQLPPGDATLAEVGAGLDYPAAREQVVDLAARQRDRGGHGATRRSQAAELLALAALAQAPGLSRRGLPSSLRSFLAALLSPGPAGPEPTASRRGSVT